MDTYLQQRHNCPICDSKEYRVLHRQIFEPIDAVTPVNSYDVTVCGQCGMIYANNIPSQKEFDDYYTSYSKYEYELSQSDYYGKVADCISSVASVSDRIADIGCGRGEVLIDLQKRGYENLVGIEPSIYNAERLKKKYNIESVNSDIKDIGDIGNFDLVIASGVLEHIVDLQESMRKISRIISDNGYFIVIVPNAEQFISTIQFPFEAFSMEHINFFTKDTLSTLMSNYGLFLDREWRDDKELYLCFQKKTCALQIEKYIGLSLDNIRAAKDKTEKFALDKTPIALWGAGTLCQWLLANTHLGNCNIIGIFDSNKNYQGHSLKGYEIKTPEELKTKEYKEAAIVTATYFFNEEIIKTIREDYKLQNQIICFP